MAKFHLWFSQKLSNLWQWHSQNTTNARAQHGHTTFASSLVPRPRPALSCMLAVWYAVVLTANTHTLRLGEHTRPRYSEGTDSNTAQLDFNTFAHF